MAKLNRRFVVSLNLAITAIDKAKQNTHDPKIILGLENHINDLSKLRSIVIHALSDPKFDFESVIRNNVEANCLACKEHVSLDCSGN